MSRHLPRTRPGRPLLRRGADRLQAGLDARSALRVEGLSDVASTALLRLDGTIGRHELVRWAPELDDLLDALHERGVLDDEPGAVPGLSALRRERLGPDLAALALDVGSTERAAQVLARRARSAVVVRGHDRAAAHVATGLAAAGVGTVALEGPDRLTTLADLTAVGPHEPEVSWRDALAESVRRLGAHPTGVGRRGRRPVAVVVCHAADVDLPWTDPELTDDLLADGLPHLPVAVSGAAARVGPFVVPGRTPCLWCLDQRAHDADAAWPALVDQVRLRHGVARAHSSVLATAAAAIAVAQVVQVVDAPVTANPVTYAAQVELRAPDATSRVLPVVRHPACGCGWAGEGDTMAG